MYAALKNSKRERERKMKTTRDRESIVLQCSNTLATHKETERQRDTYSGREKDRQRKIETHTQGERQTDTARERGRQRETERHIHSESERERYTGREREAYCMLHFLTTTK